VSGVYTIPAHLWGLFVLFYTHTFLDFGNFLTEEKNSNIFAKLVNTTNWVKNSMSVSLIIEFQYQDSKNSVSLRTRPLLEAAQYLKKRHLKYTIHPILLTCTSNQRFWISQYLFHSNAHTEDTQSILFLSLEHYTTCNPDFP
jgi:hypothetical protein